MLPSYDIPLSRALIQVWLKVVGIEVGVGAYDTVKVPGVSGKGRVGKLWNGSEVSVSRQNAIRNGNRAYHQPSKHSSS